VTLAALDRSLVRRLRYSSNLNVPPPELISKHSSKLGEAGRSPGDASTRPNCFLIIRNDRPGSVQILPALATQASSLSFSFSAPLALSLPRARRHASATCQSFLGSTLSHPHALIHDDDERHQRRIIWGVARRPRPYRRCKPPRAVVLATTQSTCITLHDCRGRRPLHVVCQHFPLALLLPC